MIITSYLPNRGEFVLSRSDDRGSLFTDKRSDRFQILIPSPELWDHPWLIHLGEQKGKSESSIYLQKLRIRCVSPQPTPTHKLIREEIKGVIYSAYSAEFCYAAHLGGLFWLSYTVELK